MNIRVRAMCAAFVIVIWILVDAGLAQTNNRVCVLVEPDTCGEWTQQFLSFCNSTNVGVSCTYCDGTNNYNNLCVIQVGSNCPVVATEICGVEWQGVCTKIDGPAPDIYYYLCKNGTETAIPCEILRC